MPVFYGQPAKSAPNEKAPPKQSFFMSSNRPERVRPMLLGCETHHEHRSFGARSGRLRGQQKRAVGCFDAVQNIGADGPRQVFDGPAGYLIGIGVGGKVRTSGHIFALHLGPAHEHGCSLFARQGVVRSEEVGAFVAFVDAFGDGPCNRAIEPIILRDVGEGGSERCCGLAFEVPQNLNHLGAREIHFGPEQPGKVAEFRSRS